MTLNIRFIAGGRQARAALVAVLFVVSGALAAAGHGLPAQASPPPSTENALACPGNLPARLASIGEARQLISVEAANSATSLAALQLWQRTGSCWVAASPPWSALIGRNGFSDHHREGDGTTPVGIFAIGPVIYGNAPNPGTKEPYHRLVCGDWWDEDPTSAEYNTFQHVPCGQQPPFGGGSEALWTETVAYPSFAVVDYNTNPVVPYAGSGIFIHADIGEPTDGCVSVALGDLDRFLRWLDPKQSPVVVMGPASQIRKL
jgi:L,D-peptidoglycan transpeptidase YkuD (ErfK/YbiS/YcfS/YnhG family)